LFISLVSWFPLFKKILFGYNHLYANNVKATSTDQEPRSTKSPLKTMAWSSAGGVRMDKRLQRS
jgi:hypothetical protein